MFAIFPFSPVKSHAFLNADSYVYNPFVIINKIYILLCGILNNSTLIYLICDHLNVVLYVLNIRQRSLYASHQIIKIHLKNLR